MPRDYGTTGAQQFASAPAVGVAGATYYNTVSKSLFVSDGTVWTEVAKGGSAPVRVGTNLSANPSFEGSSLAGWTSNKPATQPLVLDGTSAMSGVYSLRQSPNTTINEEVISLYLTGAGDTRFSCVAGQSFVFSLDVKCELANRCVQFYVAWFNGTTYLSQADVVGIADTGVAGKLNRAVFSATAPATATLASPSVIVRTMDWSPATAGEKAWLDNLNVGSATYFDGDTLDTSAYTYNWTGSPYFSTSEKWTVGGAGDNEVFIDPTEPVPVAGFPELWVDTDADAGAEMGSYTSGVWGTTPLDAVTYGPDSLRGNPIYVDANGTLRSQPQLISGSRNVIDSPAAYPVGMSIMGLSATDGVALGWGFSCTVVTFRRGFTDTVCAQYLYQNHTPQASSPVAMYRSGNGANSPMWSAWASVAQPQDTGWIAVEGGIGFETTDWINYPSGYQKCAYRRIGTKVELRGLARTVLARTGASPIFTLPVGFRPLVSEILNASVNMSIVTGAASTGTAHTHTGTYNVAARVDVAPTGVVQAVPSAIGSLPASAYFSISGLYFYTD